MGRLLPLPPRMPLDTGAMKSSVPAHPSGCDNFILGYKSFYNAPGEPVAAPPPAPVWHCAYCGQSNAAEREGCRGCQAPKPTRSAMVRESVTTWKGVPLSGLTEEERDEMAAWLTGPDAWRHPPPVLDEDMNARVLALLAQPQPRPAPLPIDSGRGLRLEKGNNKAAQRTILNRIKQCVGPR